MATRPSCKEAERCEFAEEAADQAVKKVFAILGVNVDSPESIEKFREDLRFGGRLRKLADHGMLAVIAVLAVGLAATLWAGLVTRLTNGGHQ